MELNETLSKILKNGTELKSSGTTGPQKSIWQTYTKLKNANQAARESQKINKNSKIYTICKMEHAGGLLAQTLPAYEIGAEITVKKFNPWRFCKEVVNYTHTHITPTHGRLIASTKGFRDVDMLGLWVTCGSDPVEWDLIEAFVSKGCTFMANWGMTEVGPCAINTVFDSMEKVQEFKARSLPGTIMGDHQYCHTKVVDGELYVKGMISVYGNEWYNTKDLVEINSEGEFYYKGRNNA